MNEQVGDPCVASDDPGACSHPIRFDFLVGLVWYRACALCMYGYNRSVVVLVPLRAQCKHAWSINFRRVSDAIRDEGDYRHWEFV